MKIHRLIPFAVAATVVCCGHTPSNADEHRSTARSFGNRSVTVTSKSVSVGPSRSAGQGYRASMAQASGVEVQTDAFGTNPWPSQYTQLLAPPMHQALGLECACKTVQVRDRNTPGLVVLKVTPGSIAAITGIRPDDVLLSMAGQRLSDVSDLATVVDSQNFCNGAKVILLRVEKLGKLPLSGVPDWNAAWAVDTKEPIDRGRSQAMYPQVERDSQGEHSVHRQGSALNADQIMDLIRDASIEVQQEVCQRLNEKLHPAPVVEEAVRVPENPVPHEMPAPVEPAA